MDRRRLLTFSLLASLAALAGVRRRRRAPAAQGEQVERLRTRMEAARRDLLGAAHERDAADEGPSST
jgi:hypothetical protein